MIRLEGIHEVVLGAQTYRTRDEAKVSGDILVTRLVLAFLAATMSWASPVRRVTGAGRPSARFA